MGRMFPDTSSEPKLRTYRVRFVGTGAAHPTKLRGAGIAITRAAAGTYRLTWATAPSEFVDWSHGLQATVPADVKAYKVVLGAYDATNKRIDVYIYDAANAYALVDLAAAQWLSLQLAFAETSITPIA